jgi:murein L,D-transpeptidase YcbB/YkuD
MYEALKSELKDIVEDLAEHPESVTKRIAFPGTLKPGMKHPAVITIRHRLGDVQNSDLYDEELKEKVEDFQKAHGLAADGLIGVRSFDAINQTRTQKLIKLIANLERRRWVRRPMSLRYVAVNIPQMELKAVENGQVAFEMPVIVGRTTRPTMSFVDEIVGIRFNPSWYVPDTIKSEDYLPQLQKDPNALNDHGIKFRVKNEGGFKNVSSADIDWSKVDEVGLKNIQMFQDAGGDNALGTIRVLMPNRYDIYLHDTNAPKLFAKDDRTLSSGCVRMAEPRRMANFVLGANRDWSDDRIDSYLVKGKLIEVKAAHPVPVYLFYYTAWMDKKGEIVIANDVYGADLRLVQALQKAGKIPFELSINR